MLDEKIMAHIKLDRFNFNKHSNYGNAVSSNLGSLQG